MKVSDISGVLDLARTVRKQGGEFNPMFEGGSGLGKSSSIREWAAQQGPEFGLIDLRIAFMEAPDLLGLVEIETDQNGKKRTAHCLPNFWPTSGEGILLFEEPNRGTNGVLNTLMSVLQEREFNGYKIPKGWILVGAQNPDTSSYTVNSADTALKDRFVKFEITYSHSDFCDLANRMNFCPYVTAFLNSGIWLYKSPEELGEGVTYVSPRTWKKISDANKAGGMQNRSLFNTLCTSILGKEVGGEFFKFCLNDKPVLVEDYLRDPKKALKRLGEFDTDGKRRGDLIIASASSFISEINSDKPRIAKDDLFAVANALPPDNAVSFLQEYYDSKKESRFLEVKDDIKVISSKFPSLAKLMKATMVKLAD